MLANWPPSLSDAVTDIEIHTLPVFFQKGSKADSNKSKKIFVGGIPHNCGEPELRDYFNRFGVVSIAEHTTQVSSHSLRLLEWM